MSAAAAEIDEREEAEALGRIAHAIACYRHDADGEISRWEASASSLARKYCILRKAAGGVDDGDDDDRQRRQHHRNGSLLRRHGEKCRAARAATERNARWLDSLLEATVGFSNINISSSNNSCTEEQENKEQEESSSSCSPYAPAAAAFARSLVAAGRPPSPGDADKVRYVLKNAARDWSDSGKEERDASYARIVEALRRALPAERGSRVRERQGGEGAEEGEEEEEEEEKEKEKDDGDDGGVNSTSSSFRPPPPPPRVLVPGAGLGRLCVDLVEAGYAAQGNEFSYYMLLASAFALNFCCGAGGGNGGENFDGGNGGNGDERNERNEDDDDDDGDPRPIIHPWVLTPCNWLRDEDQLAGVRVPDVDPAGVVAAAEARRQEQWRKRREEEEEARRKKNDDDGGDSVGGGGDKDPEGRQPPSSSLPPSIPDHPMKNSFPLLSMVAGDFAQVYSHPSRASSFDAVATCFFVDTARDILEYIETIKHVLVKDGTGTWVNFGPLLYHWADAASYLPSGDDDEDGEDTTSIELPLDEVLLSVAGAGFDVVELRTGVPATFNATPRSMLRSGYACAQWTAVLRKQGEEQVGEEEKEKEEEVQE